METIEINNVLINCRYIKDIYCDDHKCNMVTHSSQNEWSCRYGGLCGRLIEFKKGTNEYDDMKRIYNAFKKRVIHKKI
jgi:hypothetical protein